jgi:SnoaL-like domain
MDQAGFAALMGAIAEAWNHGESEAALRCFTDDAVYMEPPDSQLYLGREELWEFFGGDDPPPMRLDWHHLVFDERAQIGAAEYTYEGSTRYHGIVIVKLRDDRIASWREYQTQSNMDWDTFTGPSRF